MATLASVSEAGVSSYLPNGFPALALPLAKENGAFAEVGAVGRHRRRGGGAGRPFNLGRYVRLWAGTSAPVARARPLCRWKPSFFFPSPAAAGAASLRHFFCGRSSGLGKTAADSRQRSRPS